MKVNFAFPFIGVIFVFYSHVFAKNGQHLKDCTNLSEMKVVVIAEDQATEDWVKQESSQYDKLPILGPAAPDKRKRELYLRLQDSLNALVQVPTLIAWDYFFPLSLVVNPNQESRATRDFGKSLNKSRIPIVIASWQGGGELDYRIHVGGAHRFTGHISLFRDSEGIRFSPVSKIDKRIHQHLTQDSFAVATIAAVIHGKCKASKKASLKAARQLACQSADTQPTQELARIRESSKTIEIKGIKLKEMPIQTVSMKSVIQGDPVAVEVLKDAVVIVGNTIVDIGGIFKNDNIESKPLVYVHAWAIAEILSHMNVIGPFEQQRPQGLICSK
jgi:hypothetical protein